MSYHTPAPRPAPATYPVSAHVAITLRLADPSDDVLVRHVRLLRDCVALSQQRWSFGIEAAVVLPNELQLLCLFDDAQFSVRSAVKLICSAFSRHAPTGIDVVWSDDCEIIEVSSAAAALRRTFIENAPVRAGLVQRAEDWPFSSAHAGTAQSTGLGVAVA